MSKPHKPKILAGDEAVLARRYAVALFGLAEEKGVVDAVAGDLLVLQQAIDENHQFRIMAAHPRIPPSKIQAAIKNLIDAVELNDLTASFLLLVARNHRLAHLNNIIDAFLGDLAQRRGEFTARVVVARPLSQEQETKLAAQLGAMMDGTVKLVIEEDKSLIGGLVINMDSRLIDASIKGKLARLERQLKSQKEAA